MRDIFWTLIVVWVFYKLVEIFRVSQKKGTSSVHSTPGTDSHAPHRDLKKAAGRRYDKEGDYIDFEEIK